MGLLGLGCSYVILIARAGFWCQFEKVTHVPKGEMQARARLSEGRWPHTQHQAALTSQAKLAGGLFIAHRNGPDTPVSHVDAKSPLPPLSPLPASLPFFLFLLFVHIAPKNASVANRGPSSLTSRGARLRENGSLMKMSCWDLDIFLQESSPRFQGWGERAAQCIHTAG